MRRYSVALVLLFALTACGGGDGADSADSTRSSTTEGSGKPSTSADASPPEVALEKAYRTYVDAFMTGDGATAYKLLSARCRAKQPLSGFAAISEQAADVYGEVDYEIDSVKINGDRGVLDATYAVDALNQSGGSLWVFEDGEWRSDKCG